MTMMIGREEVRQQKRCVGHENRPERKILFEIYL